MFEYVVIPGWWRDLTPWYYGFERCSPGHSCGPAIRECYLLHYVLEGTGRFWKNGHVFDIYKGDIFVIGPGEVTTYQADAENPWQYAWIGFYCSKRLECLSLPVLRQAPVGRIFTSIRDHNRDGDFDGKIFSLTYDLIWQLAKNDQRSEPQSRSYAFYAKSYIDNSYMRRISIQEIADSLHIDRRYLTGLFRSAYGVPPQSYLMMLRLDKAREFLRIGYSVSESAVMAGFTDLPNFSRQYKARFGVTPGTDRISDS